MSKYYAVKFGKVPGIYSTWPECQRQVIGFSGAVYKSFKTRKEAESFCAIAKPEEKYDSVFYTDGSFRDSICGGAAIDIATKIAYYAVLGGADQTNNRGELLGILLALLQSSGSLEICTDSQYSIDVLFHGYTAKDNLDIIALITPLMVGRVVHFRYVSAHSGIHFNEVADHFAKKATELHPRAENLDFDINEEYLL